MPAEPAVAYVGKGLADWLIIFTVMFGMGAKIGKQISDLVILGSWDFLFCGTKRNLKIPQSQYQQFLNSDLRQ
jgi:hypothetical protein